MVIPGRKKAARNSKDGYHFNEKHWQLYKEQVLPMNSSLFECAVGMVLGDATMAKPYKTAHIKFEQGYKQKDFVFHLFQLFSKYCFMEQPGDREEKKGARKGQIKSYWFKTFSHTTFTRIYHSLYRGGKKYIDKDFLSGALTNRALAYWSMSDGSLQKGGREFILHSQCFTFRENQLVSSLINEKFQLSSRVIPHKKKYFVIFIPGGDAGRLRSLLQPYLIPSMLYKLPDSRVILSRGRVKEIV